MDKNRLIIYQTEDGKVKIETHFQNETVWLTIEQIAELFQKSRSTINEHILNIYNEQELDEGIMIPFYMLGENTEIERKDIHLFIRGFLVDKKVDVLIHDLTESEYKVPQGKILVINGSSYPFNLIMDGIQLGTKIKIIYSEHALSGNGTFFGYLMDEYSFFSTLEHNG